MDGILSVPILRIMIIYEMNGYHHNGHYFRCSNYKNFHDHFWEEWLP